MSVALIQNFRTRKESLIALLKRSSIGAEESKRHDKPSYRVTTQGLDADVFINIFCCGAVAACAGWWDESLDWHEGSVWPQDAILEDMLEHILRNPQYSNRN